MKVEDFGALRHEGLLSLDAQRVAGLLDSVQCRRKAKTGVGMFGRGCILKRHAYSSDLPTRNSGPGTMKYIAQRSPRLNLSQAGRDSKNKGAKCGQCEERSASLVSAFPLCFIIFL